MQIGDKSFPVPMSVYLVDQVADQLSPSNVFLLDCCMEYSLNSVIHFSQVRRDQATD